MGNELKLVIRTSNPNKLNEFKRFGLEVLIEPGEDIAEVLGTPEEVVIYKSMACGSFSVVEDTSLDVDGFDSGVNIRWLLNSIKNDLEIGPADAKIPAVWRVMMAFHDGETMFISSAEIKGHMIGKPRGFGFSFDSYFVPNSQLLTLAELDSNGLKDQYSARKIAVERILSKQCKKVDLSLIKEWSGNYQ